MVTYIGYHTKGGLSSSMAKFVDYSLGLDIGTGSVGWAAINEDYNILKLHSKDAWGAYLFDDAETAVNRRNKRSQRRRYERRQERIRLLQELMSDTVLSVDESFFIRLKDSYLRSSGVDTSYKRSNYYNLFEGDYTDKDYYKDYRTIYHLRDYIATTDEKVDIRLVYLAIHHIIKYRGNFLYEGKTIDIANGTLKEELLSYFQLLQEDFAIDLRYVNIIDLIVDAIKDKTKSKREKQDIIKSYLITKENKSNIEAFAKAILGYKFKLQDAIFSEEVILGEDDKPVELAFSSKDYEENEDKYCDISGEKTSVFNALKAIYMSILFEDITQGNTSISKAMIAKYDKHRKDLVIFKRLMKQAFPVEINEETGRPKYTEYSKMFRSKKGANYVNYIASTWNGVHYEKTISRDEFYGNVKKVLDKTPDSADKEYCLREIELEKFLPKINDVANSAIPYQMHLAELEQILDKQGEYYPELKTNADKIKKIFTFKRPYYVGTLRGEYSWNKQVINERVTPWNFYDLVNTDKLAESFITRMTNHCIVYMDEEALPLNSIVYQAYITLNEINKIKYKGHIISTEWKQAVFNELCLKYKTVKVKKLSNFLQYKYNISVEEGDITGLADDKINGTMSSYIDLKSKLKESFDIVHLKEYEETIRILTIFDDEKIRKNRLKDIGIYGNEQIRILCKIKYSKWGKYSSKLLNGILSKEQKTIVQTLYDTDKHINELLFSDDAGYKALLPSSEEKIAKFDYDRDIAGLYCSPSVKKAIWNALKIVEEVEKVAKCAPQRIFLENTQTVKQKKKTDSRVKNLVELYKVIKDSEYFNNETYEELIKINKANIKLDSDKLYLWLLQLGRCMYTGEYINFDQINECQIDHIVPRCYIKDDSFENRVLVTRLSNQYKADTLSIHPTVKSRMKDFWAFLYKEKLIGSKKYFNLTRGEYTDADKVGFINRQLVETGQTVKEVKKLLQKRYPNSIVEGVKAGMNSQFREKYRNQYSGFYKLRNLNNLHHAKDAYLTAVVGQFTTVACPLWGQEKLNIELKYYIQNNDQAQENAEILNKKRYGLILDLMEYGEPDKFALKDGEYQWNNTRYINIFRNMAKNTCHIVKKKPVMANVEFYNQTVYGPNSGKKNLIPLKRKNGEEMPTEIYGGYSNENAAYFVIVQYEKIKKKDTIIEYAFEAIPVMKVWENKSNPQAIEDYIKNIYGSNAIILKRIYRNQKINYKGHLCYITAASELNNAVELCVEPKYEKMLYLIEKGNIEVLSGDQFEHYDKLMQNFVDYYCTEVDEKMPLFKSVVARFIEIKDKYWDNMTVEEKVDLIRKMLIVSKTDAGRIDIDKKFGGGSGLGRLSGKTIYPNEVEWIDMSCTGLYCNVRKGV